MTDVGEYNRLYNRDSLMVSIAVLLWSVITKHVDGNKQITAGGWSNSYS